MKLGKLLSPARRRAAVEEIQRALPEVSERHACRVLGQPRAVQRYTARVRDDEAPLTGRIVEVASVYGRYGSPRITGNAAKRGREREPQAGGADLAAGRAEGAE